MNLDIPLHAGQMTVLTTQSKYRTVVCGRRYGKSTLGVWELILASLKCPVDCRNELMRPVVLGIMPTMMQAKKVLWLPLVNLCSTILKPLVEDINRTDHRIIFKGGKFPDIIISGANDRNGDGLRGLRLYFLLADEIQDIKPIVLDEVTLPAMADTPGSYALFTGTPKGRLNHLFQLFGMSEQRPDLYKSFNFPSTANPLIDKEEVARKKLILPPRVYRQEYEASFEDFPGKIYTELATDNICYEFTPNTLKYVVMGIDWGQIHPAISVIGRDNYTWYWLEGYSPGQARDSQPVTQPVFDSHIRRLAKKWSVNMVLADPAQPSSILGVRQLGLRDSHKGLQNCIAGYNAISEGIDQVHSLIVQKRLLYTQGLADSLPDAVDGELAHQLHEAYHWEQDKEGNIKEGVPADGYCSHICDSTRYALANKLVKV